MKNEVVDRVLSGQATSDEAMSVACWFEHPQGSLDLVERIDHDLNREWEKYYVRPSLHATWKHWLYRVACALLIVVVSLAGGYTAYRQYIQPMPVTDMVAYAARGERTQVVLQDGTRIYLNSDTRITFPSRFSLTERRIHLDGEAYFEVSKNAHRPFVVEMDQASVKVLGTQFNAKSYANAPISVSLDEGCVRFCAPEMQEIQLKPGEVVDYDAQSTTAHVSKSNGKNVSAWRDHRIDIQNMPLADVIKMLERNYNVTFRVHNDKCYRHAFTLSMDDRDFEEVLKRMDRLSPLSFAYNDKNRTIDVY